MPLQNDTVDECLGLTFHIHANFGGLARDAAIDRAGFQAKGTQTNKNACRIFCVGGNPSRRKWHVVPGPGGMVAGSLLKRGNVVFGTKEFSCSILR